MKRRILAAVTAIFMMVSLGGCGNKKTSKTQSEVLQEQPKNTVIVAMNPESEPVSGFDPSYGWGAGEHVHEPLIQSTLVTTDSDLSIQYDLAVDMQVSDDGLAWTVKIRDDVKFTDGKPLTASDVAFTFNIVKENSTVSDFTMLNYAEAVDDTTVVFHLNQPYAVWPYSMAVVGIVPEHAYNQNYGQHPVGSGRYIMKQWDKGQQIIFEANPDYYGEPVQMKRLVVLFMSEDAAFAAVKAGQVDVAYTAALYADQKVEGYDLLTVKTVDNRGINLPAIPVGENGGNDFTADVKVRQAINIGFDRQEMIENVLNGYGTPAYSVCDGMPWYSPENEVKFEPEKAAELLDEAGWKRNENGMREKEGKAAQLNILYPMGDSTRQALAADLANQLMELGIQASTEGVGWDAAYDRARSQPLMWGWGAHTPMELYNIYHSVNGSAVYSPYKNTKADGWMDEALRSTDLNDSYELWKKAQSEELIKDVPWVWLVNVDHLFWVNQDLQVAQQKLHPHGHGWSIVNNVDQWTWKQA